MQYLFPTVAKMFHHWTGPYEAEGHLLHTGQWNTGCIDAVGTAHRQAHSSQLSSAAMPLLSSFTAASCCFRPGLLPLQLALALKPPQKEVTTISNFT